MQAVVNFPVFTKTIGLSNEYSFQWQSALKQIYNGYFVAVIANNRGEL